MKDDDEIPETLQLELGFDQGPRFKRDRPTSEAAARGTRNYQNTLRYRAFRFIKERGKTGATANEVEIEFLVPRQTSASTAVTALKELAMVKDSGETRPTVTGYQGIVWVATEKWERPAVRRRILCERIAKVEREIELKQLAIEDLKNYDQGYDSAAERRRQQWEDAYDADPEDWEDTH